MSSGEDARDKRLSVQDGFGSEGSAQDEDVVGTVFSQPTRRSIECADFNEGWLSNHARRLMASCVWKAISVVSLMGALFFNALVNCLNLPDDPSVQIGDVLMVIVTVFFVAEIVISSIARRRYLNGYFFWMDFLGTLSMAFEVSFIFGSQGKMNSVEGNKSDAVLMRTARASKVAARSGRLMKLTKVISVFQKGRSSRYSLNKRKADVISAKLIHVMSTKISLLTIVLVLALPVFSIMLYPQEDFSLEAWANAVEEDYATAALSAAQLATRSTNLFEESIRRFMAFFDDRTYFPYAMEAYYPSVMVNGTLVSVPGQALLNKPMPNRKQNIYHQQAFNGCELPRPRCSHAAVFFDLTEPGRLASGMDAALIAFVILVMVFVSANVSQYVRTIVLAPMDRMLSTMRQHTSSFMQSVDKSDNTADTVDEIRMLERVFKKLAKLYDIGKADAIDESTLATMDAVDKAVVGDILGREAPKALRGPAFDWATSSRNTVDFEDAEPICRVEESDDLINSWDLDVLTMDQSTRNGYCLRIFLETPLTKKAAKKFVVNDVFTVFFERAVGMYNDPPYHNSNHACDVLHSVYRIMSEARCEEWVSHLEIYSLLVAALCHDIGHEGRTNQFLVETRHDWAITFNDLSPLENMHCSSLFNICKDLSANIFGFLKDADYKRSRSVIIQAILHTDLAKHFDMVKDVKSAYEVGSDTIQKSLKSESTNLFGISPLGDDYLNDVLRKNLNLYLQVFLHLADVNNPLKPFSICRAWAFRVLDEFFEQGDEEKRLGIPVGMLNDRNTVNRPGSQHGFISFLVAPLVFATVDIFPQLRQLPMQMALNMEEWRNLWVEDANPDAEAVAKKDADVSAKKRYAQEQHDRIVTIALV